jgi:gamma-glutamyltranspeptidase/glutathione hydrolase
MDLHTAGHKRGVAAAPHSAAVEAGRHVLAEGGNALEAMVAMGASIAAVYPHMAHIGGDAFWLIREPKGRVLAIMAAGRAGTKATPDFYRGHDVISPRGPLAALTAPGTVAGWVAALDAAKQYRGRLPLDVLLADAIGHARNGYAVSKSQANLTAAKLPELKAAPGFATAFLADGKAPQTGATLRQSTFADTLEQLTHAGLEDFYRGDVGREIAADLERIGSPVTRDDLKNCRASVAQPLSVSTAAGTLYNTPPPTQGFASLMILALFAHLRVTEAEGFDHVHGLIESTKRAFRLRDRFLGDPAQMAQPIHRFLQPDFLAAEATKIDRRKAAPWPAAYKEGDTVWMGAADSNGLVVSYIQSLYWEFGSGCVLPRTGVVMQNRGASFSLDPKSHNRVAPGGLPVHTLNPALAVLKDGRVIGYGTMGGDGQPQTQAALFTRHVTFRQDLAAAIDRPRWLLGRTWGDPRDNLRLENRFDGNLADRLLAAGHDVEMLAEGYSDVMGHAGAVLLHPNGTLEGAHDPRADGGAAGV